MCPFSQSLARCLPALFITAFLSPRASSAQVVERIVQSTPTERAEALFRQGRGLLEQRQYDEACPLLDESFRLEPETGTLLAFAVCLEGQGKLAGALKAYDQVAERAAGSGRTDREGFARERAALLRTKVSTLKVVPPTEDATIPGFRLLSDGVEITERAWGVAIPVDGGEHVLEVSAPGKLSETHRLLISQSGDHQTVILPRLEDSTPATSPVLPSDSDLVEATPRPSSTANETPSPAVPAAPASIFRTQVAGAAMTAAGIVGLGIGTYFGVRAIHRQSDFENGCRPGACSDAARYALDDARFAGNMSTISLVAGGVLSAAGVTLLVFSAQLDGQQPTVHPGMAFAGSAAELRVRGAF